MKNFRCSGGQTLFFENNLCLECGEQVGFDPSTFTMRPVADRQLCRNGVEYDVCNWIVSDPKSDYCLSCELNQTIPNLMSPHRRRWWKILEHAKRRLIYSLLMMDLPIVSKQDSTSGLAFQFIEDKRTNPQVSEEYVSTGYSDGLITINIAEADEVSRELSRQFTGELYRTLLGHFRHESGHYYFNILVEQSGRLEQFRELFGDERQDYATALESYYANKSSLVKAPDCISLYAQSHPLEDWAEVWAHYLHMYDTLDTANFYGINQGSNCRKDIDGMLVNWSQLAMMLNALNRSMGMEDAYPFTLSEGVLRKFRFVHDLIYPN